MPDSKITALTALTAADPAVDMFPIVDVSDTTMAASGTTKRISINNLLAASGTATLASATITGDLTVDTSTLKVDSTNNRVGIGTASPADSLHIFGAGNALIEGTAGIYAKAITKVGAKSWQFGYRSGTLQYEIQEDGVERYTIGNGGTPHTWYIGASTAMTLNATGLGVGVVPSAGKGALQLSSGINFPATQVASSDANTLDDYEEGTWTGTLKGLSADPTTPVTATGRYTKIGRNVTVQISFEGVNTTGASGACYITGLPFANGNVRTAGSAASFLGLTFTGTLVAIVDGSATQIDFIDTRSNAAWVQAPHNAGSGRTISASLTYTV